MYSEHNTFVRVVDRCNLITIERVWSLWHNHIACLTSVDHPHEAFGLIDSSRMLVHCRTLSMVDADRTLSISLCRLLECSRSSAKELERLMKLSLKFGGLMTFEAHLLTSRTLGRNPRVLTKDPASFHSSFLFFSFLTQKAFFTPPFLSRIRSVHALPFLSF